MTVGKALALALLLAGCKDGVRASKDGAVLFQTSCVTCHGLDGHGTDYGRRWKAPDFADPAVQALSDDELAAIIKNGKNQMPPWGGVYSPDQIRSLVAHLRTFRR
jgi:mono/diheme cytochrome c family protein